MRNVGAHCASAANPGANTRYVGVIFIVGSQQDLTPKAVAAFYDLQKEVLKAFPGATQVLGHRQVRGASTTCPGNRVDRKSTRLNSSHVAISYAVFCLKNK